MHIPYRTLPITFLRWHRLYEANIVAGIGMGSVRRRTFTLDEGKKIWLTSMEVGMRELDGFRCRLRAYKALLKSRYLSETVKVELTDKRREVLVLEPFPQ